MSRKKVKRQMRELETRTRYWRSRVMGLEEQVAALQRQVDAGRQGRWVWQVEAAAVGSKREGEER